MDTQCGETSLNEYKLGFIQVIKGIHLTGPPGAGKTNLIRRTHEILHGRIKLHVIIAGREASTDYDKLGSVGIPAYGGRNLTKTWDCFLEKLYSQKQLSSDNIIFIENTSNYEESTGWDAPSILVSSIAEGDDKPLKYPDVYANADLIIVNKIDLIPFSDFLWERFNHNLHQINSKVEVIPISCRTGVGLNLWRDWLLSYYGKSLVEESKECKAN